MILIITGAFLTATAVVYMSGETGYFVTDLLFIPILITAARFGTFGGLLAGLLAGLLTGPIIPHAVQTSLDQTTLEWSVRLVFFVAVGAFAGWQFDRLARQRARNLDTMRRDTGTGLPNQVALEQDLEAAVRQSVEPQRDNGLTRDVCLVLVRLADLLEALDAVGHDADDEIIRMVAERLRQRIPWVDRVYRFSNLELAIVYQFHDMGDADEELFHRVEELRKVAQQPVSVHQIPVRLEPVFGLALARAGDGDQIYNLIRRAHLALRVAQSRERHYLIHEASLDPQQTESFLLIARVEEALADDRFELWYQPQLRLDDGTVVAFEALLRWIDSDGNMIPPGKFLPRVERTSLVEPLERFVAGSAIDFARRWTDWPVAINISSRSLHDAGFVDELATSLDRAGVDRGRFRIEVNGSTLLRDPAVVASRLRKLHEEGLAVHIDDFGGEYTSFDSLCHMPVAGAKLDASLVRVIEWNECAATLIGCMAQAARKLDLQVAAKGVESAEQRSRLEAEGCLYAQGHHLGEPMREQDLDVWLQSRRS